jgi:hypothetical protein
MDKKLKRTLAEFILGERKELELYGNPKTLAIVYEAAMSSRELVLALESGSSDSVSAALLRKREATRMFEQHTAQKWSI